MARTAVLRLVSMTAFLISITACTHSSAPSHSSAASTGPSTTSSKARSTLPSPPPNSSSVASFLRSAGSSVLAFEQATMVLGSGSAPSQTTCTKISHQLPSADSSGSLFSVVNQIPDPILRYQLSQDIQNKGALLASCLSGHASPSLVTAAQKSSNSVHQLLSQIGL